MFSMGNLSTLYKKVDACSFCQSAHNPLQHIHGFGSLNARCMLVLINPTYRNISSAPDYQGPRFPFIGVRQFWRVLGESGFVDASIARSLPLRNQWTRAHTALVQKELLRNRLFLTNIVKCCYPHGNYPAQEVITAQKDILGKEIRSVRPKRIVAFGALTFKVLTGKAITLSAYRYKESKIFYESLSGLGTPVIPCYFPTGRGSPRKAAQALSGML